jgi:hypothetical protein
MTIAATVAGVATMHVQKAHADPASVIAATGPQSFPPSLVQKAACGGIHSCCIAAMSQGSHQIPSAVRLSLAPRTSEVR